MGRHDLRLLGAILAGGASSRFGPDKARALHHGKPLLGHVIAALSLQVTSLAVIGRDWPGMLRVDDRPVPGLGPLGGLCGALVHAAGNGFDAVLVAPCDTLDLPADLVLRLGAGPAVAAGQRSVGLWPATLAPALLEWLGEGRSRALNAWVMASGAREIDCGALRNINTPADLA